MPHAAALGQVGGDRHCLEGLGVSWPVGRELCGNTHQTGCVVGALDTSNQHLPVQPTQ